MNHKEKLPSQNVILVNNCIPQVAELKKKHDAQAQMMRQKQKSDETANGLQDEIQRIKTQMVAL